MKTAPVERVVIDARVGGSFSCLVRRDNRLIDHTGEHRGRARAGA